MPKTFAAWWSALLVLCISYICSDALQIPGDDRRLTMVYRRGDVSGLFPFPRVGRAHISSEDVFDQRSQGSPEGSVSKRQGLIPFPRVGKRHQRHGFSLPPGDAFYDEYVGVGRGPGVGGALAAEDDRWAGEELGKRSAGEGAAQEGMWFGPRLGRRRRRSAGGPGGKRPSGTSSYWTVVDETGGPTREYLEHRPDPMLRSKEMLIRPEEDDFSPEEPDVLYGDASETPGVEAAVEEESSPLAGRRRRRQPVDERTTKAGEEKVAEGRNDGASAATTSSRWKGGRA